MCKALIIGAGGVGTVVTQKIAANPVFTDVMLASRTKSKCDAVAAAIGGNRVKTAEVDADSVPQLCELFRAFKPDIVVNVALPYQDLTIMDACLECGCNYLDTANYEPKDEAHFEYSWQWARVRCRMLPIPFQVYWFIFVKICHGVRINVIGCPFLYDTGTNNRFAVCIYYYTRHGLYLHLFSHLVTTAGSSLISHCIAATYN